ncbi:hypothetical protein K8T06_04000 [bacterium]|nr:hypothetical protein [bacterium]
MDLNPLSAPWHKETFDRFLMEQLPELLASRIPLEEYTVVPDSNSVCSIEIAVSVSQTNQNDPIRVTLQNIPCPDENGLFHIDANTIVVIPVASSENLDKAEIKCVGELLYDFIEPRIGDAPSELQWDEPLVRSWLPVDKWITEFLTFPGNGTGIDTGDSRQKSFITSQCLDTMNWISRHEHPRRLLIMDRKKFITSSQIGRVCPIQTPEGPNVGRVLAIARGAVIRNRRLEIIDDSAQASLSLTASMIPFLENNEPVRALMGTNMIRQWQVADDPEPALVRTGFEPDEHGFWNGKNLLTAFISLGETTFEDGIVISESASRRLNWQGIIEPGDKISNRHGTKGVISQILPDNQMPHLPDGTPVDLVYSFIGQQTRMNFGQLKEAVLGRIARATGKHIQSPPFHGISDIELKQMLKAQNMDESGMVKLTDGESGEAFQRPSTVGYVYWGLTIHLSRRKVFARPRGYQRQGQAEYFQLRDIGAYDLIQDMYNTGSAFHENAHNLPDRIANCDLNPASPPSPIFKDLTKQLAVAGIQMDLNKEKVLFKFKQIKDEFLPLACTVQHPWLPQRELTEIGVLKDSDAFNRLCETNARMKRVLNGHAPKRLLEQSRKNLQKVVDEFFSTLIDKRQLHQTTRVVFSGRAIVAPGIGLKWNEVGLPEEISWALFGSLAAAQLNSMEEVEKRSQEATRVLDSIMKEKWIVINRAPSIYPTSMLAFQPIRTPEKVVRLHPFSCQLLNGDYDGDQVAVILPVTDAGQADAKEKLTMAAHLNRDPKLSNLFRPTHEAMWGIANLSRKKAGRKKLVALLGVDLQQSNDILDTQMIAEAYKRILAEKGVESMLQVADEMFAMGFIETRHQGASHSPFGSIYDSDKTIPTDLTQNKAIQYFDKIRNLLISDADYNDPVLGPQLLSAVSGAQGNSEILVQGQYCQLLKNFRDEWIIIENGMIQGLTWQEYTTVAAAGRIRLGGIVRHYEELGAELWRKNAPKGMNVLARAARLECPGTVFARAAAIRESDPLTDPDSRLFVGLKPF